MSVEVYRRAMNEESGAAGAGGPRRSARCHASSRRLDAAKRAARGLRFLLDGELPEMLMKSGAAANKQAAEDMIKAYWPRTSPERQNQILEAYLNELGRGVTGNQVTIPFLSCTSWVVSKPRSLYSAFSSFQLMSV